MQDNLKCKDCTYFVRIHDNDKVCCVCKRSGECIDVSHDATMDACCLYEQARPIAVQIFNAENARDKHDAVHPNHYHKGGLECFDVIKAITGDKYDGFLVGNIIKYIFRYRDKNGVEDCKKAAVYLDKLIKELTDNDEE